MAMRALMLFGDTDWQTWLESHVGTDSHVVRSDAGDLVDGLESVREAGDIDLLFVRLHADSAVSPALVIESLVAAHPDVPCVGLAASDDSDVVLGALRAGAVDVFVRGRDDKRLASLSARVLNRPGEVAAAPRAAPERARHGRLVSLVSAAQSPQLAYSMVHMGMALREALDGQDARVLLIDLSLPGGDAEIMFDTVSGFSVLDALRDIERCDDTLIDSAFPTLDGGCYLLSLPEATQDLRLVDELRDVDQLVARCRAFFDYTIVCGDAGMGLQALGSLVSESDQALLVSDQSVLRSRQTKALLSVLRDRGQSADKLRLLIADYQPQAGIDPERLAELLDLPLHAALGGKIATRLEAMNLGKSMFKHAPGDSFVSDIRALTARVFELEQNARQSTGLAARLQRLWRR